MKLKTEDLILVNYKVHCSKYLEMFGRVDAQASRKVTKQIDEIYSFVHNSLRGVGSEVYWNITYHYKA